MTKDEGKKAKRKLPERWSAQQKTEVVLRLMRGEDLGEVSREIQVPAHEIEEWRWEHQSQQGRRVVRWHLP